MAAMIISTCAVCGAEDTEIRQAVVTVERWSDHGMSVNRFYVCKTHEQLIMDMLTPTDDELEKTAGVCGND